MIISNVDFIFTVEINVPESELKNFIEGDLRGAIDSKKRKMSKSSELEATKEALDRVTQEMDVIKNELVKIRGDRAASSSYAFGFSPVEFNSMNFTDGLSWIADELAPRVKIEAEKYKGFFKMSKMFETIKPMGVRICARFNRGESCKPAWHVHSKPNRNGQGQHRELRLHCCAVCAETFDVFAHHHVLSCPWLKLETWAKIEAEESDQV